MVKRAAVVPTLKAPYYMSYNLSHCAYHSWAAQYPSCNEMRFVVFPNRLVDALPDLTALLTLAGLE